MNDCFQCRFAKQYQMRLVDASLLICCKQSPPSLPFLGFECASRSFSPFDFHGESLQASSSVEFLRLRDCCFPISIFRSQKP
ncbi:hypothetical protein KFK09_027826 [Dendrobium nobile]|uniref:Uncharacterized protein n=1 Tax=Dendrobium nobile TaxID=94219 RepID=A0A8T3A5N6_DENNO|nr:hypothetical protein KFK09_027826 [Dendrobium nobile]